jgi:predicted ATP-grasp superfamily ATP-dependent carboligase
MPDCVARPAVVLLGVSGHPRAIAAIRSLGRAGIRVIGVERDDVPQRAFSRYLHTRVRVNPTPEALLPFLEAQSGRPIVMALDDDYLITASKHVDSLARWVVPTMPRWDHLTRVMNHAILYRVAREIGVETPAFFKPDDEAALRALVPTLDLGRREYLLKTVPGTVPAEARNGRYTKIASVDADRFEAECREIAARLGEFPLIAEVVPGDATHCIGVCMLVDHGQTPVIAYAMKRLRLFTYSRGGFVHPYELGANVYCESVHDDEAIDAATRLVRATGYVGVITVEFRRDSMTGRLMLLKADPRFVRATSLSSALGLDLPTALYRLFVERVDGGAVSASTGAAHPAYREGVAWLWATMYLENVWDNRDNRAVRRELLTLVRNVRRVKSLAHVSLRDPLPGLLHVQWRGRVWLAARARGLARRLRNRGPSALTSGNCSNGRGL